MTRRRYLAPMAGLAAMGIVLVACSGGSTSDPTESAAPAGPLHIGIADDIQSWDTVAASGGQTLQAYQAPYDSLLRQLPDGELAPMLATAWKYDDAQTALTLDLVSDVTFSDGEAFDADAVKANFEYFSAGQGPQTSQLAGLESVEVVDDDTVVVNLSAPDPALLSYLAGAAGLMASPAAIDAGTLAKEPVGTGPYVLESAVAGSQYVFSAREDYWAPELQLFSDVEFIYLDDTAIVNALVSGQVDSAAVEADSLAPVEGAGRSVISTSSDWEGLIIMDRDGAIIPALADARVRQAINHAIDRDALNDALAGGVAEPTNQVFGPDSGSFVAELDDAYAYDPDEARKLLAEAGYPDGFEITVPAPGPLGNSWTIVGQYLADVGITVTPEGIPFEDFRGDIAGGKYPVALFRYNVGDPWGITIRNYISTKAGVWNPFHTETDELNGLLEDVQNGGDDYREAAKAVNEYVVDEGWFVPFYYPVQNYAYDGTKIDVVEQAGSPVPALYNFSPID